MKNAVIFSGAGLSQESGIPTFRDSKDGLWHNHKIEEVATPEGWAANPKLVLKFYQDRFKNIQECEPNEGHKAIARLQEKYYVVNITQNIDDLLERAGCHHVWHLHGSILERKCEYHKSVDPTGCTYLETHDHPAEISEKCPKCGSQVRPNVVWFGEAVDMKDAWLNELIKRTDVFIGVGTSAQVQPAAGLLFQFRNTPVKYFIDPVPPLRLQSFTRLTGTACEHLPKVVEELLELDRPMQKFSEWSKIRSVSELIEQAENVIVDFNNDQSKETWGNLTDADRCISGWLSHGELTLEERSILLQVFHKVDTIVLQFHSKLKHWKN